MANLYWATSRTGGTAGTLDGISVTDAQGNGQDVPLVAGDAAFCLHNGGPMDIYVLQDSAGATEDGVKVIIPDDNTGNLWWKLYTFGQLVGMIVWLEGTVVPDGWLQHGAALPGWIRKT